jgi:preprotein translocase subunit SecA
MFKIFGDSNERELKKLRRKVDEINALEPEFVRLSDQELKDKTTEFKARYEDGDSLDELLPETFAAVREAARRTIGERHFDVQLMGGMVLHQGKIAEMATGEGKTLVATLPASLNSLTKEGVHVVTVNDYLAKRDTQWMGPVYHALGISVGCIQHEAAFLFDPEYDSGDPNWRHLRPVPKREAYLADITYGTNNEFGFDYLRDNMVRDLSQCVQRELNYAIVDEVDNILIDEARTPLIISGPAEESTKMYYTCAQLIPRLRPNQDYTVEEKWRTVTLTASGIANLERWLGLPNLYDSSHQALVHHIENALRAHVLYQRDREYVIDRDEDGQPGIVIVDEFTGRKMPGRRYNEGLHQAIEAKEGVKIRRESITLATVTFQNYFRMYDKLAGMTGTAATEAEEFYKIYKLDVVVIPTNRPLIRHEYPDQIYKTEEGKFRTVAQEIEELHRQGRPVLVGTVSIEKSEQLSEMLRRKGIPHQVLNAKLHEKEAGIIAQAGKLGSVTIATNMAGRGVDIILGGKPQEREPEEWQGEHNKVVELDGLHVIGTERHEARRIDNQLRGRAGRQGDPGSSRFYVSMDDDIMRRFGGDQIKRLMDWAKFDEDTPIEHSLITKAIKNTQVKVEAYHFDVRKHLLDYDDVLNKQREMIYAQRKQLFSGADLKSNILEMVTKEIENLFDAHLGDDRERDLDGLLAAMTAIVPLPPSLNARALSQMDEEEIEDQLFDYVCSRYEERERELGPENMRVLERLVMLRSIDSRWIEHLTAMEDMRNGIGLEAMGQRDPLVEYKRIAHNMFQDLQDSIEHDIVHTIYHVGIVKQEAPAREPVPPEKKVPAAVSGKKKVGRNDPCPCGSGKKYKHCCGRKR